MLHLIEKVHTFRFGSSQKRKCERLSVKGKSYEQVVATDELRNHRSENSLRRTIG